MIDYTRCTNCMECLDFCLFGVYGVDKLDTILIEQPDNCRKGCPACSRVCPENAIIFPQHKTPAIAGSDERAGVLEDRSFETLRRRRRGRRADGGGARARRAAYARRPRRGRHGGRRPQAPDRQASGPKDELDSLMDQLDGCDL